MGSDYSKMTVAELFDRYAEFKEPAWKATRSGEKSKLREFRYISGSLLKFFGPKTLGELCAGDELRNLCHAFAASRDAEPATVRKQLSLLVRVLKWAWNQRWIGGLPPSWLPPVTEGRARRLSDGEVETLLDAAGAYPTERHVKVFVYLALFTPAQQHAILDLTWDRVDFTKGVITLDGYARQPRQKVTMHDRLRKVLEEAASVKEPGSKHVVSWRGKKVNNVWGTFKRLLVRVGLDDVTAHDLRRWQDGEAELGDELDDEDQEGRLVISYCTKDGMLRAAALCEELEARGQLCWIAPRNIGAGAYPGQIIEAIENGIGLVVVLTPLANESSAVLQEVNAAHDLKKHILPVIVDKTAPSRDLRFFLGTPQHTHWSEAATVAAAILRLLEIDSKRR